MLYKVFDFADKEAHDVMVPRPEVVALSVELPPQEALAAVIDSPYTRYPVYRDSLDDVLGDPACPRPLPRAVRPRNRQRRHRAHRPPGVRRAGDEGPRLASRRVPAPEPAPGARRGRVRLGAGNRDARGPAGGDRRRDRGRVRPSGRVDRADRGRPHPRPRHLHDRRLQRALRHRAAAGGLPHARRARVRDARARRGAGRRGRRPTACSSGSSRSTARASSASRSSSGLRLPEEEPSPEAASGGK